jgi:hypothetical protein
MKQLLALLVVAIALGSCGSEQDLEATSFNAYFYYPDNGREEFLGEVYGLSACQMAARSQAQTLNMSTANWSYICCEITASSSCASKHK